jgi:hypothetical protein
MPWTFVRVGDKSDVASRLCSCPPRVPRAGLLFAYGVTNAGKTFTIMVGTCVPLRRPHSHPSPYQIIRVPHWSPHSYESLSLTFHTHRQHNTMPLAHVHTRTGHAGGPGRASSGLIGDIPPHAAGRPDQHPARLQVRVCLCVCVCVCRCVCGCLSGVSLPSS